MYILYVFILQIQGYILYTYLSILYALLYRIFVFFILCRYFVGYFWRLILGKVGSRMLFLSVFQRVVVVRFRQAFWVQFLGLGIVLVFDNGVVSMVIGIILVGSVLGKVGRILYLVLIFIWDFFFYEFYFQLFLVLLDRFFFFRFF